MSIPNFQGILTMRMAATQMGFSHPPGFDLGLRSSGHLRLLCDPNTCFVSCGFRLQCGGCTSQAQNLKFRAQNFDLHRSDPQRSGTPKWQVLSQTPCCRSCCDACLSLAARQQYFSYRAILWPGPFAEMCRGFL